MGRCIVKYFLQFLRILFFSFLEEGLHMVFPLAHPCVHLWYGDAVFSFDAEMDQA